MNIQVMQWLQQAISEHQQGHFQAAERLYRAVLQQQPHHPQANFHLGLIANALGQTTMALPFFKQAVTSEPKVPQYWLVYIDTLITSGDVRLAQQTLKKAKKHCVDKRELQAREAKLRRPPNQPPQNALDNIVQLYQAGRLDAALKLAVALVKQYPKASHGHRVLGVIQLQLGQNKAAQQAFETCLSLVPNDAETHSSLATALHNLQQYDAAVENYNRAISLAPDYAEAHNNLGNTLLSLAKTDEAITSFKQAIDLNPDYVEAIYNLATALQTSKQYELALTYFNRALSIRPDYADALLNRGLLALAQKDYRQALDDFDQVHSQEAEARALMCLYKLGQIDTLFSRLMVSAESTCTNLRVAALAAFVSHQTQRPNPYQFCQAPLDFVYRSKLALHSDKPNKLIENIMSELNDVATTWEPVGKTTQHGYQSTVDVFESNGEAMRALRTIVDKEITQYRQAFNASNAHFIQYWPENPRINAWFVELHKGGFQAPHIHPDGWLSGVIYLNVVPDNDQQEGAITFTLNGEGFAAPNAPSVTVVPQAGDIVLFPSSLYHTTVPFSADEKRVIISFDLRPN